MSIGVAVRPGTEIGNRFFLDREAGSGGMGTVYCAFDRVTGEPVAVKVLRGREALDVERFVQEAALLAELDHPAIVRYLAHGVADSGEHWLAMEWLEGEDLGHRLARAPLSLGECLSLAVRVADALAAAHGRGMVHRDLKPGNLFLPGGDVSRVKLVDFGIARLADDPRRLTCTGVLMGTIGYIAPEQIQGAKVADPRADVFALGCVLYECLTGRPAFAGINPMAVLAKILLQGSPSVRALRPDLPEDLAEIVQAMLATDPEKRPRDGAEVAAALAALSPIEDDDGLASDRSARRSRPTLPPPSSLRGPTSLGLGELRLVSVVLAGEMDAVERTLPAVDADARLPDIEDAIEAYGGRIALCAGRSLVVTIWSNGDATDRAERAAQCALAVQARAAGLPICVVTGRGVVAARLVGGELLDRGAIALRETPPGVVRLDEATASALGSRYHVERDGAGHVLHGLRPDVTIDPPPLREPGPCVGRDREIAVLLGMFEGCAAEPVAGAVLVVGPAGVGKSRLCREVEGRLEGRATMLAGRGESLDTGSPYGIVADAVRRAAGMRDGDSARERRRKLEERVARRLAGADAARVAAFLGELARTPFPNEAHETLRAARRDPMLMGDSIKSAFEDWIAAECAAGPVVLVLEDLQWGDAATVRLVDATLRNLRELPLLVLALARPDVLTRFPGMLAERDLHVVRLGPLPRRASEALVRERLGAGAAPEIVARVVEQGGGNPFYLQELARAVTAGRGDALPASVLDAVEARLDAEGSEAKRVLRAASIFGRRFSGQGIAALTGLLPDHAREWLVRLEARELIDQAGGLAGDPDYLFRHALVREAAYVTLTDDDRALGHRLAGEWLEQRGHADALAMAMHFRRGGLPERSAPWYLRAADQALGASELDAAIERAEEGVACAGGASVIIGGLRLVQAEAHMWRGELALARERGGEATRLLAPGSGSWFRAVTQVVLAAGRLGELDRVEAWSDAAATTPAEPGAAGARIACLGFCASQLIFGGRTDATERLLDAIEEAQEGSALDAQTRAFVHQAHSFRASAAGDLGGCREGLEAALAAFDEAGDRRNACVARSNLGHVYAELGAYERAEEALRAALAAADRMGLADLASVAQANLGLVLAHRGRLDEARLVEQRAVEAFRRQGDRRLLGLAQAYLAQITLAARDLDPAERAAMAAVETLAAVPPLLAFARAVLARVLLGAGRLREAHAAASDAYAILSALVELEEGEALVRLVRAETAIARGDARDLPAVLGAARERLLARAARIRDAGWRERFLGDVADNARTLALAGAWAPQNR